ncbi:MAG: hypothetical protein KF773_26430 [Deltaproteobacteria bacterium]|nr:hypothetical protein [Deltaproteobacteria bacterium]MCW5804912.1 hypothetical protein [Deltaproteobacteria bacterium]
MKKRQRILIVVDEPLAKWRELGPKLYALDPDSFARVLAAADAFVACHQKKLEPLDVFEARLAAINGKRGVA